MVTGSVSGNVFTFTKGDGSTFDLEIPTGSVSDSGSFVVTGSISGSVLNFEKGDVISFDIQLPSSTISDTGSFLITGSVSGSLLTLEKGDGSSFDLVLPSGTGDTGSLIVTASLSGSTLNFEKGDGSSFNVTLTGQGTPDGTYRLERTDGAEASLRGFGINANSIYDATEISINNVDYRYINKGDYYYRITTGSLLRFYNYTTGDYFAKEVTDVTPGYSAFTFEVRNVYGDEIPAIINELYEVDVDSAGSSTAAPIPSGSFLISASLSGSTLTFEKNDLSTFDLELPETDSGSLLISASLSGSTLIFEKGDSSTFGIDLVTDTGSFVAWSKDEPKSESEKIMKDVRTWFYASSDFEELLQLLRLELENFDKSVPDIDTWRLDYVEELRVRHRFYSDYAKENWQEQKEDNILSLISRLQKAEKTEKKEILKARLKDESPQRAIQSLYRIELRNHIKLSDIADTKANILLSVNAIIISLLLANLLPKLDSPSNSYLIYPTVIFVLFSIASMIMSVLATRPKVDNAEVVENDINKKDTNYLFFGNFHTMEIKDFKAKLRDIIKSKESIYDSLSMDLYYLGKVLQEKYRLLRWTYTVFLVGIILSVIAFGFALKYYGMEDELLDAVTPLPKE